MGVPWRDDADGDRLQRWESIVDKAIREAQERGDFDDLPGRGKPLRLEENPLAGEREMGFRILKNAGVLPYWMEVEREIGADRAALDAARERSARFLREETVRAVSTSGVSVASGEVDRRPARSRWWGSRRRDVRGDGTRGDGRRDVAVLESERRRARRAYLEGAVRLDEKIARFNEALPDDLRWRQRPRLTPEQAAAEFDATCPPVGREPTVG